MQKYIVIALLTILSLPLREGWGGSMLAQVTQPGLALEYQGEKPKTPLAGVGITAQNAGATQSAADGTFALNFRTMHVGDNIQMRRIERSGYEVMNQEMVEDFRIGREGTSPIQIVMITKSRLNELRNGYRSVAARRYEKQLQASEQEVERLRAEGKLAEEEYNNRMNALEEEYEERLTQLEYYIDKFARIDLSELDNIEQQIIALVQAGDMDGALRLYEEQGLPAKLAQSRADREQLTQAQTQLAQAQQEQEQKNFRLRQSIDRQVTLLLMMGGEENQRKALDLCREVYMADTTHIDAIIDYAVILASLNYLDESIALLGRSIDLATQTYDRLRLMGHRVYFIARTDAEAEQQYRLWQQVYELAMTIADSDYRVRTRVMPQLTAQMINLLPLLDKSDEIETWIGRLRQQWEPDTLDYISVQNYLDVLIGLAAQDSQNERHAQSVQDVSEALALNAVLRDRAPWLARDYYLQALACHIYTFEDMYDEALAAGRLSVASMTEWLPKLQATQEVTSMTMYAYLVMESMTMSEQYAAGDSLWQQLEALRLLALTEQRYPGLMDAYTNISRLFASYIALACGETAKAEAQMHAALTTLDSIDDAAGMMPYLRPSSLARVALAKGEYAQAEALCREAIDAQLAAVEGQPDTWDADNLCHYYVLLADVAQAQGNRKQAGRWLKEAGKYAVFEMDRRLIRQRK